MAELGSGGFGFVLHCVRRSDSKNVAVKFIFKNKINAKGWVKDSQLGPVPLEVHLLRKCNHPNIVEFVDYYDDQRFVYLVMGMHGCSWSEDGYSPLALRAASKRPASIPRRNSQDLFEAIEQHTRFSENQSKLVFRQIVDAISYLHQHGLVHRDIKDENILVDQNFNVKIIGKH